MHGQTYKTYMYFHFFSPEGKKFRSKTEVERYIFEKGLNVDPASIDFTVRGAKNSKKPNIVRAQLQGGKPKTDKTPKLKKDTPKAKANVSKTRSPEGSPKKSLAQKLVIKMKFSTPPKGGTVSKLTKRRSSSSKAVKKKVETKGVKRKADKLTKPPSKRSKIAIKGKTEGKGVKKKVTLPKPKAKKEKKAVEEQQEDDENEEEMEDEEEVEYEEEADEEENSAEGETQSDSEAEEEADIERTYDENYDASDYRYSLEEEAINQVDDSDDEEEEEDEEEEAEWEEEGEANDDVNIEQYEKESPFVDQVKSENVRVVKETDNVVDAEVVEAESLDVVVGNDTDNDSAVEESVDTAQCFPESGEETDNGADENNDRYKVEQLLNRTEGMTVQDAYETSIRLGHFSDLQKVQRRSPRATPSRFGNSARRNSYEKSRSFSDSYEWEPIHTRRKSQTSESSKDVNENNNIVVHTEPLKKSVSDSKVLVTDNKSETASSKSETVQSVKQSPRPKRKASLGSQVVERNSSVEASPIKTETSQSVKQSPRLKRKSSAGGKVSERNDTKPSSPVKTETVQKVEHSPRPKRKTSLDTVSNEQAKRRKSSEIQKSPSRSPRARTVSEPAPSPKHEIPPPVENTEDDRYGPDGEYCYLP